MATQVNQGCQRDTWTTYIGVILEEAESETTGPIKSPQTFSEKIKALRPYFFTTSVVADQVQSKDASENNTHTQSEEKGKSFTIVASSALAYIFSVQLKAANESVRKTEEMMAHAAVLFSWHMQLQKIDHPFAKISTEIQKLIDQVHTIDKIRARQANNRLRASGLFLLGSTTWIIGAFVPARWMTTLGKVILAFTFFYYGFSWAWHLNDQKNMTKTYEQIGELGDKIHLALSYYDPNMKLQYKSQIQYQPSCFADAKYQPTPPSQNDLKNILYEDLSQEA